MRRIALGFVIAAITVMMFASFLGSLKPVAAGDNENYIVQRVDHTIQVMSNGYFLVNDTIRIVGNASQGTTLSSLNTHQQDFRGNDFYKAIRTLLERARSYPLLARKRGMEGTVFISFVIGSRGLPQDVKIMKSSGHQILDEEVKKMLKKASPFPGIKGEIVIPITFKLTDSISNR